MGGLGLRDMHFHNNTLLMKLGFQLVCDVDKLWVRILKEKYKWIGVLPLSIIRIDASRLWKGLSNLWRYICRSVSWQIRDGWLTDFWYDVWVDGKEPLAAHCLLQEPPPRIPTAAMVDQAGCWD
ncbi:hypothetical protein V6N11_067791 [Hibiscus sabdariffa]|uniref:Reverse transcriptase zinc-binding domain-containing protein n=1 Tax=Hibiscus sabdariffa TaxID=183260 RepID=A0ABR2SRV8_9ROSI